MRALSSVLILLSGFLLVLGVTQPLLTFERLIFFTQSPSLLAIVGALANDGDWLLALLVGAISIAFPALKLIGLQLSLALPDKQAANLARWLSAISKWSMMDVVLVAIVIFAAKTSGLASAFTQTGLWFYAASAITGAIAAALAKGKGTTPNSIDD